MKSLADAVEFNETIPLDLMMCNKNQTWKLAHFLSRDFAMELPSVYIHIFYDILDWDIVSARYLPSDVIIRFGHLINWRIFLNNGFPKSIDALYANYAKIKDNIDMFFNIHLKRRYYNTPFIMKFHDIVDWRWISKNIIVDEEILLKFWDKFIKRYISKKQIITVRVVREYADELDWNAVSKRNVRDILYVARDYLNWEIICRKSKLPDYILCSYDKYLNWANVAKYQSLSEWFIEKYMSRLDMRLVCEYQNLSYEFIKKNRNKIIFGSLIVNNNYNKPNSIKIAYIHDQFIVIRPQASNVIFA